MHGKIASVILISLLAMSTLVLAFRIQPVKANGTVYSRADGSVEGSTDIPTTDNEMVGSRTSLPNTIDPQADLGNGVCVELVENVYETLITFDKGKSNSFVPLLATSWNVSEDGLAYTFTIRQGVKFQNGEILTTEDVEYSMKRILVMDPGWAGWLLYTALFNLSGSRDEGNIIVTAEQLNSAITRTSTTVAFHLLSPFPPFLQVLCSPTVSILCKDWCVSIGDWPGTWNNWTYYNRRASLIDQQNTDPPGPHVNAMCGTGPYMLDYYERGVEYSLVRFDDYWGGWPAPGLDSSLSRVTVKKIDDWATKRDLFLAGQLDFLDVQATAVNELLGQPGVQCVYPLPELEVYAMGFNFNISTTSPFLGVAGGLPLGTFNESGIPPDFFDDVNVRKGFAYAFNYTQLIDEALLGDAFQPATPIIPGLPYCNPDQEKYTQNLNMASELLQTAWGGQLWTNGFNMTISYYSARSQVACENIKANVESLNPRFHIGIENVSDDAYSSYGWAQELPIVMDGWAVDYADPHDFAQAFMKYEGTYGFWQDYRNATVEGLVEQGIATTNATQRQGIYYQLQRLYYEDCPGVPLFQPIGRAFMRTCVQGWFYETTLGWIGEGGPHYFYTEWKENLPPYPLSPGENLVDSINSTGTVVSINTTLSGNLTVTSHDISLEGTTEQGTNMSAVKCVTVDTTVPHENITFPIEIRIYYTDQEVVSANVDQSTLRMFYWNGTDWILENETGAVVPSDIPGYAGYVWARIWHLSEFAVMGQKTLIHAVAPIGVRSAKDFVGQGLTTTIYVDAFNQGDYQETLNITVYANTTLIGSFTNLTLSARNSATIAIAGNTSTLVKGTYQLVAVVDPVPGENATTDNTLMGGQMRVTIPGDINGDGAVNILDAIVLSNAFLATPGSSNWNPNADINGDNVVNILDAIILSNHFLERYP